MTNQKPKFKSSDIQIKHISPTDKKRLKTFYHQLYEQVNFILERMIVMRGRPRTIRNIDGTEIFVSQEEADQQLLSLAGGSHEGVKYLKQYYESCVDAGKPAKYAANMFLTKTISGTNPLQCHTAVYKLYKKVQAKQITKKEFIDKLYSKTKKKKSLKPAYKVFTENEHIEFYHKVRSGKLPASEVRLEESRRAPDVGLEVGLLLRELGIFPFNFPHFTEKKYLDLAWTIAIRWLKNWNENNKNTAKEKAKQKAIVDKLRTSLDQKEVDLFEEFAEECSQEQFGIREGFVKAKKRLKSFPKGIEKSSYKEGMRILVQNKHGSIWDNFENLAYHHIALNEYNRLRDEASFSFPDPIYHPIRAEFGLTSLPKFNVGLNDRGNYEFTINLPDGPLMMLGKKSRYYLKPIIQGPLNNAFSFEFIKGNKKRPKISAKLKSITVVFAKSSIYVGLPYRPISIPIPQAVTNSTYYFKKNLSSTSKFDKDVFMGLTAVSVDLGLNPVFSMSACRLDEMKADEHYSCEVPGFGWANQIWSKRAGGVWNRSFRDKIRGFVPGNLSDRIFCCKKSIIVSKKLRDEKPLTQYEEENFERWMQVVGVDPNEDHYKQLRIAIRDIKTEYETVRSEFALRDHPNNSNKTTENICTECFDMLFVIKNLISLLKSWNRWHRTTGDIEERGKDPNECSTYWRHYNGLKTDLLKKLTNILIESAKSIGAHIIILEDLTLSQRSSRSRRENSLVAIFGAQTIIKTISEEAEINGILVYLEDPRHSSQISIVTNEFGYRPKEDKAKLYFMDEETVCVTNCDDSAALMLQQSFWSRHKDVVKVKGTKVSDTEYLVSSEDKDGTKMRLRSYLKRNVGTANAILQKNCDGYDLKKISPQKKKKIEEFGKDEYFYRHGEQWFTADAHFDKLREFGNQVFLTPQSQIKRINLQVEGT